MPVPGLPSGLIDWYAFGEILYDDSLGTLIDYVGGHPGSFKVPPVLNGINATPILLAQAGDRVPWGCTLGGGIEGIPLPAIIPNHDLDGTNPWILDVAYPGSSPWYDSADCTLIIWAKFIGAYATDEIGLPYQTEQTVFGDEVSSGAGRIGWKIHTPDSVNAFFRADPSGDDIWFGEFPDADWHMYSVTSGGGVISTYLDAGLVSQEVRAGFATGNAGLHWMSRNASGPSDVQFADVWNGQAGDTLIFDRALSFGEIEQVYTSNCSPLVARIARRFRSV